MPDDDRTVRQELLDTLISRVDEDTYPSYTMLDMIESLLEPDEVPAYAELLLAKARDDRFPSIPLLQRVQALA